MIQQKPTSPEIMAPAGSFDAISAAIQAGAHSIYFGVGHLNMRARAAINFETEDLAKIANRVKKAGMKAYLTVNTVMYNHDLKIMHEIIDQARIAGINAIIASDMAVIQYAVDTGMPVHLSTQANISNVEALAWYARYADVMVLARELSLKQVEQVADAIRQRNICGPSGKPVQLEIFAHGALCMAISGKCYLSLHTYNASANRGACMQNCRKPYLVTDKEDGFEFEVDNEYIMSAKDLCTIPILPEMMASGASVFKIEGRGRSPEYVYTTVKAYREAIESIQNENFSPEKVRQWEFDLSKVYNRGFWEGYYMGRKLGAWANTGGSQATEKKVYLGKGVKYFERIGVGEFLLEAQEINVNDRILVTGPTTGVHYAKVKEIRVNNEVVNSAKRGKAISIPIGVKIRPSDKLYKIIAVE